MVVLFAPVGGAFANCFVPSTPNDGYFDQTWGGSGLGCVLFVGDNTDAAASSALRKIVPASDGGLVLGGYATGVASDYWWLGKIDASGIFVPTFGDSDGSGRITECTLKACGSLSFTDFALQTDGKVSVLNKNYATRTTVDAHALDTTVAGGTGSVANGFTIGSPNGTLNASDPTGSGIAIAPGGKTFAVGFGYPPGAVFADFGIARLGSDLSVDTSFHAAAGSGITYAGGNFIAMVDSGLGARPAEASQIFQMADGRLVLAASNGYHDILIARLTSDGSLDTSFNSNGTHVVTSFPATLAYSATFSSHPALVDRGGRVVFATYASKDGLYGPLLTRFNADGTQDTSSPDQGYGAGWVFYNTFTACPNSGFQLSVDRPLAIDSAGRILILGNCDSAFGVIRLRGDTLALDTSWGVNGMAHGHFDAASTSEEADVIAFDPAGHLFIGGATYPGGPPLKSAIARLTYDLINTNNFEDTPPGCLPPNCN